MTATYTNQAGVVDVDTVRLKVNDKDTIPESDALLSDEEIQYFVDSNSDINLAASEAALAIAAKYSADANSKTVGDMGIVFAGARARQYRLMAQDLRKKAGRNVTPYAGGLSNADATAVAKDTDRPTPDFERGMHDHEKAGQTADRGVIDF